MSDVCGLPIVDMPDDIAPLAALVVVKALDTDGDLTYFARATDGVTVVEALGMARLADIRLSAALTESDEEST